MHLIQSLENEFCFDLPMFSKYLATSINSYFYKMTLFWLIDLTECPIMSSFDNLESIEGPIVITGYDK